MWTFILKFHSEVWIIRKIRILSIPNLAKSGGTDFSRPDFLENSSKGLFGFFWRSDCGRLCRREIRLSDSRDSFFLQMMNQSFHWRESSKRNLKFPLLKRAP